MSEKKLRQTTRPTTKKGTLADARSSATSPPLFMQPEAVNPDAHRGLYYLPAVNDAFARAAYTLPLTLAEMVPAAGHAPVVFVRQGNEWGVVMLTGTGAGGRCGVDAGDVWQGYRPRYLRYYPFIAGVPEAGGAPLLCLDRAFAGFTPHNSAGAFRLFSEDDTPGEWLLQVQREMAVHQVALDSTREALRRLVAQDVLRSAAATVVQDGADARRVEGFFVVDRAAFGALPAEVLGEWRDAGLLEGVYAHLLSLQHPFPLPPWELTDTPEPTTVAPPSVSGRG